MQRMPVLEVALQSNRVFVNLLASGCPTDQQGRERRSICWLADQSPLLFWRPVDFFAGDCNTLFANTCCLALSPLNLWLDIQIGRLLFVHDEWFLLIQLLSSSSSPFFFKKKNPEKKKKGETLRNLNILRLWELKKKKEPVEIYEWG